LPLKGKGIITGSQLDFLRAFSSLEDSGHFYLTGGTALAEFYLGHRRSFDLDLFTAERGLVLPFSRSLEKELQGRFELKVVRRFETFVELEASRPGEELKVQLAFDSPFRFEEPVESKNTRTTSGSGRSRCWPTQTPAKSRSSFWRLAEKSCAISTQVVRVKPRSLQSLLDLFFPPSPSAIH
jgi:hypothetical protein